VAVNKTFETVGPSKLTITVNGEALSMEIVQVAKADEVDEPNKSDKFAAHYANLTKPPKRVPIDPKTLKSPVYIHSGYGWGFGELPNRDEGEDSKNVNVVTGCFLCRFLKRIGLS